MRVNYKKKVLDNLRNTPIKIENNYENQNDYSRELRDANRSHQNNIREEKKKFNDPEYIPDKLKQDYPTIIRIFVELSIFLCISYPARAYWIFE